MYSVADKGRALPAFSPTDIAARLQSNVTGDCAQISIPLNIRSQQHHNTAIPSKTAAIMTDFPPPPVNTIGMSIDAAVVQLWPPQQSL